MQRVIVIDMDKTIAIGSQVFFSGYKDYNSHDTDFVIFQDEQQFGNKFTAVRQMNPEEVDYFYYQNMPKEDFIEYELTHAKGLPMAAGKMIVPELAEYIGLTIEDLKRFESAFDRMDAKHKYEKVIYDAYVENGEFKLTRKQKNAAFKAYQEARNGGTDIND